MYEILVSEASDYTKLAQSICAGTHNYKTLLAAAARNNLPVKKLLTVVGEAKMQRETCFRVHYIFHLESGAQVRRKERASKQNHLNVW